MSSSTNADARSAKLQTAFQNLSAASRTLNLASDAFGESTRALDDSINKLNPGVTAWVTVSSSTLDENAIPPQFFEERLGYAKVSGRWGLILCTVTIDSEDGTEETNESWSFNDAPRDFRLRAINLVPALMEALAKVAEDTAKKVVDGAELAKELAISVSRIANAKDRR